MSASSKGENWIRLLRSYSPVGENEAMQAEQVDRLAKHYKIPKLSFDHPVKKDLFSCFPRSTGKFKNVVLTGTAGDGKTSLCIDLLQELTGESTLNETGLSEFSVDTERGKRSVTIIYDVTAWRKEERVRSAGEDITLLAEMADSVYADSDKVFVLAVNDGQMHELFRTLPAEVDEKIRKLQGDLISLHARGQQNFNENLELINLSHVRSEDIMTHCLDALLNRSEWNCFKEEDDSPLFAEGSSIRNNYFLLRTSEIQGKLLTLAKVADLTGRHLPIRGVFCLLTNALLGHPDAKDGVIRTKKEASQLLSEKMPYRAAFHRNLFGENLSKGARNKRGVYRFLSMLHIGEETTTNLDELIVFGERDPDLTDAYKELVARDLFGQRNLEFRNMLNAYIRGDISGDKEANIFLKELASERRRIFLHSTDAQMQSHELWQTTVFHHGGDYIKEVLSPLNAGKMPGRAYLRKIVSGLNRIWTGLLLTDNANEIYFATGLDLTTSPVSDIFLAQTDLDAEPPALEISLQKSSSIPDLTIRTNQKSFVFKLDLPRFEFLCRVADGAMPSSFSRESSSDFMALKQRCLRDLGLQVGKRTLNLIEVRDAGMIHKRPIHLADQ